MTASELLSDLRERGVKLWVEGTDLRFSAPNGALGFGATQLLARHKSELVRLLKSGPESDAPKRQAARASRGFSLDTDVIAVSSVANWSIRRPRRVIRQLRATGTHVRRSVRSSASVCRLAGANVWAVRFGWESTSGAPDVMTLTVAAGRARGRGSPGGRPPRSGSVGRATAP